jgi:hypothetical protein
MRVRFEIWTQVARSLGPLSGYLDALWDSHIPFPNGLPETLQRLDYDSHNVTLQATILPASLAPQLRG